MNQNPLIDSSQTPVLNPALTTALASLEVQLDQELTRYRRTRKNARQQPLSSVESYTRNKKTALLTDIQLPAVPPIATPPENPLLTKETEAINFPQDFAISEIEETPTPPNLEKSSSSIVLTKIQPVENQTLLTTNDTPKQPDDYLESSEALLRSLTAEAPQTQTPNSPKSRDSVLSPMGIGSMLLLLLATLTLGYVVLNPKTLPKFNFSNLPNNNSSPIAVNTEVIENNSQPTSEPKITPIAKYPNLATQEFRQIRNPQDIVDLTPKIKPTPQIVPTPLAIQPPIIPITPITPLPTLSPLSTLSTPLPKPTATASPLTEDMKLSTNGYYYIIADNQGDKALTAAKQVVPDAYLSPNQKFIYLGALKTKDEIKRKLQELEAKGIKGRLEEP
ncbi:hypothetical protein VB638_18775 [Dolichospermum sp. UHCC 0684]|uniref:hypothetical protein n=1 Tax=unclassified Dolichospermum TaxID=2622029 RepID=UPI0014470E84|nr:MULTISPECIES: hypothetical protein [unclassified Dolichospermum]MEA5531586.1 hypothetical protein [Dolichospermum sp. UHCC 0684]MTJ37109.1 hypothetical protein [Dolichospermum sp. UHCC 0260]